MRFVAQEFLWIFSHDDNRDENILVGDAPRVWTILGLQFNIFPQRIITMPANMELLL